MTEPTLAGVVFDSVETRSKLEELTKAVWRGSFTTEDKEWHDLRASGIGGSEIGVICGLSQWDSPYSLWAKKTAKFEDSFSDNEAMYWGRAAEEIILKRFVEEHPDYQVLYNCGTWSHEDREWQIANPDGVYLDENGEAGILEIKTAQFEDQWDFQTGSVPPTYRAQVLWYLATFGFKKAKIAVLFHGNKYAEFEIEPNDFEMEVNLSKAVEFQQFVTENKAPDFDGATATYEAVRKVHPEIEDTEIELGELGIELLAANLISEEATARVTEAKSRVVDAMGKAKKGLVNGDHIVSRQAKGNGSPFLIMKRGTK